MKNTAAGVDHNAKQGYPVVFPRLLIDVAIPCFSKKERGKSTNPFTCQPRLGNYGISQRGGLFLKKERSQNSRARVSWQPGDMGADIDARLTTNLR